MTGRDEKEDTTNHAKHKEETRVLFKPLLAFMFANIPWAKASHMDQPRVRMGACLRFFAFYMLQPRIRLPQVTRWLISALFKCHLIRSPSLGTHYELALVAPFLPHNSLFFPNMLYINIYLYTCLSFASPTEI